MVFTERRRTFFNFWGKVFDAKAWRWRKQWVPCMCGISCFISAENPDLFPRIAVAPSVHTEPIRWISNSCFAKKSFTNWNTFLLWWLLSAFYRGGSFPLWYHHGQWTHLTGEISGLQFKTSVVSSKWNAIFKGPAFICEITCSKTSVLKSGSEKRQ